MGIPRYFLNHPVLSSKVAEDQIRYMNKGCRDRFGLGRKYMGPASEDCRISFEAEVEASMLDVPDGSSFEVSAVRGTRQPFEPRLEVSIFGAHPGARHLWCCLSYRAQKDLKQR